MRRVWTLLMALCLLSGVYASDDYPPARWIPAYSGNYWEKWQTSPEEFNRFQQKIL